MAKELELTSLSDIIPNSIAHDKNVQSIITAIDPELQKVSQDTREAFIISRIGELPENVIDLLAWQWHVDFYEPDLPITTKRELVLETIKWHRQKGTKASIESALKKLGFVPTITEWFESGLNSEPHTFSVSGYYKYNDLKVDFLGPDTDEILTRVIEITKPARSKMLSLMVAPIPIDFHKHTCYWDDCIWGHPEIELHDWGLLPLPIFEHDPVAGIDFVRGFNVVGDTQFWDMSIWDGTPYRDLKYGQNFERGILVNLDRESTATWFIPYNWGKFTWSERYSRDFELDFMRGMKSDANIKQQPFGTVYIVGMYASLQPYWDFHTWQYHINWGEDFGVPHIGQGFERGNKAAVQWTKEEAPAAKWSEYRTWGDATWDKAPTNAGTWETGAWIDNFEEEVA